MPNPPTTFDEWMQNFDDWYKRFGPACAYKELTQDGMIKIAEEYADYIVDLSNQT